MSEPPLPAVVIVTGGTGAGKTSYARRIAERLGAVRFSADDWLEVLFGGERPGTADYAWYSERHTRLGTMIRDVAAQVLALGTCVVLDLGFSDRSQRVAAARWARQHGGSPCVHYVAVDAELRWQRVQERNREQGETFAMKVTREMFDFMESRYQVPNDDEAPLTIVS